MTYARTGALSVATSASAWKPSRRRLSTPTVCRWSDRAACGCAYPRRTRTAQRSANGDVILAVDGQRVDHPNQIQSIIYGRDPGERVQLTLLDEDSGDKILEVELGEREEERRLARGEERLKGLGLRVNR